ncbi:unnamed protein product [Dracunculus medinensis]|uniref:Uncharacterized protein n=1 Tax=Dracunculus medinensis TaxID=318479 RepID=A0A3P7PTM9_DRAME|nr:unnamed protein product [Dracunculus medinensis]
MKINFSVEKGNNSDTAVKLRHLEASLEQLKDSIESIVDISRDENYQSAKIASLKSQLQLKDSLITSFKKDGCPSDQVKEKRTKLVCVRCKCVIIDSNSTKFTNDKPFDLPKCEMKNSVDIEKEMIMHWYIVESLFEFDNIGVTNPDGGVKYLACSECEYGPIGFYCNDALHYYLAAERICLSNC